MITSKQAMEAINRISNFCEEIDYHISEEERTGYRMIDDVYIVKQYISHSQPKQQDIVRDCHKCVYEVGCHGNPVNCKSYKRDAPDGGYYG